MLERVAALLYPAQAKKVAEAWRLLSQPEARRSIQVAHDLERLVSDKQLGEPGFIGRLLFLNDQWEILYLSTQLRVHAYSVEGVKRLRAVADVREIKTALVGYIDQMLPLQKQNGFHAASAHGANLWAPWFPWVPRGPDYEALTRLEGVHCPP